MHLPLDPVQATMHILVSLSRASFLLILFRFGCCLPIVVWFLLTSFVKSVCISYSPLKRGLDGGMPRRKFTGEIALFDSLEEDRLFASSSFFIVDLKSSVCVLCVSSEYTSFLCPDCFKLSLRCYML